MIKDWRRYRSGGGARRDREGQAERDERQWELDTGRRIALERAEGITFEVRGGDKYPDNSPVMNRGEGTRITYGVYTRGDRAPQTRTGILYTETHEGTTYKFGVARVGRAGWYDITDLQTGYSVGRLEKSLPDALATVRGTVSNARMRQSLEQDRARRRRATGG